MEIRSVASFLDYFARVRQRTVQVIAVIPPDKLDWSYLPGKFSLGDQVRHIAATERHLFAEVVAGGRSTYQGCGRELTAGYEEVLAYLNRMHEESLFIFNSLDEQALLRQCITPGGTGITAWKWLRAMTEHEIHHRAQIYLYLNMLGIRTPPIFGLTEEEVRQHSIRS